MSNANEGWKEVIDGLTDDQFIDLMRGILTTLKRNNDLTVKDRGDRGDHHEEKAEAQKYNFWKG